MEEKKQMVTGQFARGHVNWEKEIFHGCCAPPEIHCECRELRQAIPGVAHLFAIGFGGRRYLQVEVDEKGEIISIRKVPVLVPKDAR